MEEFLFFVLLIFLLCLALAWILSAKRSIKETKNALFHARNGNEPNCSDLTEHFLADQHHQHYLRDPGGSNHLVVTWPIWHQWCQFRTWLGMLAQNNRCQHLIQAATRGSKRINCRLQSCLCLARGKCPSMQRPAHQGLPIRASYYRKTGWQKPLLGLF